MTSLPWTLGFLAALVLVARSLFDVRFVVPFYVLTFGTMLARVGHFEVQPFTWVKLASLVPLVGVMLVHARLGERGRRRAATFVVAMIALNVVEAVVEDARTGHVANALVGLALVLSTRGPGHVEASGDARTPLAYRAPWSWVLAYTAWNFVFVLGHYPARALDHVAVLAAPVVVAALARDPSRWGAARVLTLSAFSCAVVTVRDALGAPWSPDVVALPPGAYAASLAVAAVLAAWAVVERVSGRAAALAAEPAGSGGAS